MTIRGSRRLLPILFLTLLLLSACKTRISGQIVDADTRQPIEGAVVLIHRGVGCFNPLKSFEMINNLEVLTDRQGRFDTDYSTDAKYRCTSKGVFISNVMILASGYIMEYFDAGNPPRPLEDFSRGPVGLNRIKYQVEYERYARRLKERDWSWSWVNQENAPVWLAALEKLRAAPVRKVGEPGVFVSQSRATFDQIGLVNLWNYHAPWKGTAILACDRSTGQVQGWNVSGAKIRLSMPTEAGLSIVGYHSRSKYPFLARNDQLYFPAKFDYIGIDHSQSLKWSSMKSQAGEIHFAANYSRSGLVATVEGPKRQLGIYKLEETAVGEYSIGATVNRNSYVPLFPKGRPSIECMARGPEDDSLIIVANTPNGRAFLYLPAGGTFSNAEPEFRKFDVRDSVLSTEVTACAASEEQHFYVALKDQGIRKFEVPAYYLGIDKRPRTEAPFAWSSKDSVLGNTSGPKNFTSLIVAERDKGWYAVYGVAADQNVYRFTADGVPDQRMEIDLPR